MADDKKLNGCSDLGPCPPSGNDTDNNEAMREWYVLKKKTFININNYIFEF